MRIEEYLNQLTKHKSLIIHHRKKIGGVIHEPFKSSEWIYLAKKIILHSDSFYVDEYDAVNIHKRCQKFYESRYYGKLDKVEISIWVLANWQAYCNATSSNPA